MRFFIVLADIMMGLILGAFVYGALSRTWIAFQYWWVAVLIVVASVLVVLFRRPNGSLARRRGDAEGR